jgi:Protein of unknown function with HXXEE motif
MAMSFLRDNWYNIGAAIFVALAFIMGFWGDQLSQIQVILIFSYMALLVHQYEEYALPGGGPIVLNRLFYGEKQDYDRYPGNKQSCLVINALAYPFYIVPIFFPNLIWWGLATMFVGFLQFVAHGIIMNVKGRTWYNPGLAAVVFLHIPIGIYYIAYVQQNGLTTWLDYVLGVIGLVVAYVIIILLPTRLFGSRDTPYPFSAEEINRFNIIGKLRAKGIE